jgi:hypothetical protein
VFEAQVVCCHSPRGWHGVLECGVCPGPNRRCLGALDDPSIRPPTESGWETTRHWRAIFDHERDRLGYQVELIEGAVTTAGECSPETVARAAPRSGTSYSAPSVETRKGAGPRLWRQPCPPIAHRTSGRISHTALSDQFNLRATRHTVRLQLWRDASQS